MNSTESVPFRVRSIIKNNYFSMKPRTIDESCVLLRASTAPQCYYLNIITVPETGMNNFNKITVEAIPI